MRQEAMPMERPRRTIGQGIDEGVEQAKETGQNISQSNRHIPYIPLIEDTTGQKIQEAGDKIRERRETIGQQVDQGVLDARKKGSELSELLRKF
jgi:hypothetical protein